MCYTGHISGSTSPVWNVQWHRHLSIELEINEIACYWGWQWARTHHTIQRKSVQRCLTPMHAYIWVTHINTCQQMSPHVRQPPRGFAAQYFVAHLASKKIAYPILADHNWTPSHADICMTLDICWIATAIHESCMQATSAHTQSASKALNSSCFDYFNIRLRESSGFIISCSGDS